jgi:outer membrane murein-binding lipoprotein Lpp
MRALVLLALAAVTLASCEKPVNRAELRRYDASTNARIDTLVERTNELQARVDRLEAN